MLLLIIATAAFFSTLCGGLLALRLRDKLHLILGFSAGAVIGVAFFDLLPEAIEFGEKFHSPAGILSWTAVGFLFYLVMDRILQFHGDPAPRGRFAAGVLCGHSLLDGIAIGLAFQASRDVGIVVAIAVLTHDFSDGINTMNIVMKNRGNQQLALRWLLADALAPVLGAASPPVSLRFPTATSARCWRYLPVSSSTSAPAISSRKATTRIRNFSPPPRLWPAPACCTWQLR